MQILGAYAEILLRGVRDISFSKSANDQHSAQNCAEIASVDLFFGDRASTALNMGNRILQLHL